MKNTTKQQLTKHDHPEWSRANLSNTQPKSQLSCAVCGLGFWPRRALGRLEAWVEGGERVWVRPEWGEQVRDVRWGNVWNAVWVFFLRNFILSLKILTWLHPYTLTLAEGYHISEHVKLPGSVKCPALGQIVSSAYIISTSKRKHSKRQNLPAFLEQNEYPYVFFNPGWIIRKKSRHEHRTGLITNTECFKSQPISQGRNIAGDPRYFAPSAWMQLTHGYRQIVMALSWPRKGGGKKSSRSAKCERFALARRMDMFWGRRGW